MKQRGFTLIEVLVALVLVSLMALLTWRAVDGMQRAGQITQSSEYSVQRVETAMAQWMTDLDALTETGVISSLDFDGRRLRLTRRSSDRSEGVIVVAWALQETPQGKMWRRWAAPATTSRAGLITAAQAADRWGQTPLAEDAPRTVTLMRVNQWQLFYFRGDSWTNPLSASGESVPPSQASTNGDAQSGVIKPPDGVQLILDLPARSNLEAPSPAADRGAGNNASVAVGSRARDFTGGLSGKLTRYWMAPHNSAVSGS